MFGRARFHSGLTQCLQKPLGVPSHHVTSRRGASLSAAARRLETSRVEPSRESARLAESPSRLRAKPGQARHDPAQSTSLYFTATLEIRAPRNNGSLLYTVIGELQACNLTVPPIFRWIRCFLFVPSFILPPVYRLTLPLYPLSDIHRPTCVSLKLNTRRDYLYVPFTAEPRYILAHRTLFALRENSVSK